MLAGIGNSFQQAFVELSPPTGQPIDGFALARSAFTALTAATDQCAQAMAADGGAIAVRIFDYLAIQYFASHQPLL